VWERQEEVGGWSFQEVEGLEGLICGLSEEAQEGQWRPCVEGCNYEGGQGQDITFLSPMIVKHVKGF